jgi:AP-1 complex subunit mu
MSGLGCSAIYFLD